MPASSAMVEVITAAHELAMVDDAQRVADGLLLLATAAATSKSRSPKQVDTLVIITAMSS